MVEPNTPPHGYRSSVEYLSKKDILTCGLNGVDYSNDGGKNWKWISKEGFHVCRIARIGTQYFSLAIMEKWKAGLEIVNCEWFRVLFTYTHVQRLSSISFTDGRLFIIRVKKTISNIAFFIYNVGSRYGQVIAIFTINFINLIPPLR